MFYKSVKQECLTRVSRKSVLEERQVRVSSKGVLQECHLSVWIQGVSQVSLLEMWQISIVSVCQHTCRHSGSWASSCFSVFSYITGSFLFTKRCRKAGCFTGELRLFHLWHSTLQGARRAAVQLPTAGEAAVTGLRAQGILKEVDSWISKVWKTCRKLYFLICLMVVLIIWLIFCGLK